MYRLPPCAALPRKDSLTKKRLRPTSASNTTANFRTAEGFADEEAIETLDRLGRAPSWYKPAEGFADEEAIETKRSERALLLQKKPGEDLGDEEGKRKKTLVVRVFVKKK